MKVFLFFIISFTICTSSSSDIDSVVDEKDNQRAQDDVQNVQEVEDVKPIPIINLSPQGKIVKPRRGRILSFEDYHTKSSTDLKYNVKPIDTRRQSSVDFNREHKLKRRKKRKREIPLNWEEIINLKFNQELKENPMVYGTYKTDRGSRQFQQKKINETIITPNTKNKLYHYIEPKTSKISVYKTNAVNEKSIPIASFVPDWSTEHLKFIKIANISDALIFLNWVETYFHQQLYNDHLLYNIVFNNLLYNPVVIGTIHSLNHLYFFKYGKLTRNRLVGHEIDDSDVLMPFRRGDDFIKTIFSGIQEYINEKKTDLSKRKQIDKLYRVEQTLFMHYSYLDEVLCAEFAISLSTFFEVDEFDVDKSPESFINFYDHLDLNLLPNMKCFYWLLRRGVAMAYENEAGEFLRRDEPLIFNNTIQQTQWGITRFTQLIDAFMMKLFYQAGSDEVFIFGRKNAIANLDYGKENIGKIWGDHSEEVLAKIQYIATYIYTSSMHVIHVKLHRNLLNTFHGSPLRRANKLNRNQDSPRLSEVSAVSVYNSSDPLQGSKGLNSPRTYSNSDIESEDSTMSFEGFYFHQKPSIIYPSLEGNFNNYQYSKSKVLDKLGIVPIEEEGESVLAESGIMSMKSKQPISPKESIMKKSFSIDSVGSTELQRPPFTVANDYAMGQKEGVVRGSMKRCVFEKLYPITLRDTNSRRNSLLSRKRGDSIKKNTSSSGSSSPRYSFMEYSKCKLFGDRRIKLLRIRESRFLLNSIISSISSLSDRETPLFKKTIFNLYQYNFNESSPSLFLTELRTFSPILANSVFNQIFLKKNIEFPEHIINEMSIEIKSRLKKLSTIVNKEDFPIISSRVLSSTIINFYKNALHLNSNYNTNCSIYRLNSSDELCTDMKHITTPEIYRMVLMLYTLLKGEIETTLSKLKRPAFDSLLLYELYNRCIQYTFTGEKFDKFYQEETEPKVDVLLKDYEKHQNADIPKETIAGLDFFKLRNFQVTMISVLPSIYMALKGGIIESRDMIPMNNTISKNRVFKQIEKHRQIIEISNIFIKHLNLDQFDNVKIFDFEGTMSQNNKMPLVNIDEYILPTNGEIQRAITRQFKKEVATKTSECENTPKIETSISHSSKPNLPLGKLTAENLKKLDDPGLRLNFREKVDDALSSRGKSVQMSNIMEEEPPVKEIRTECKTITKSIPPSDSGQSFMTTNDLLNMGVIIEGKMASNFDMSYFDFAVDEDGHYEVILAPLNTSWGFQSSYRSNRSDLLLFPYSMNRFPVVSRRRVKLEDEDKKEPLSASMSKISVPQSFATSMSNIYQSSFPVQMFGPPDYFRHLRKMDLSARTRHPGWSMFEALVLGLLRPSPIHSETFTSQNLSPIESGLIFRQKVSMNDLFFNLFLSGIGDYSHLYSILNSDFVGPYFFIFRREMGMSSIPNFYPSEHFIQRFNGISVFDYPMGSQRSKSSNRPKEQAKTTLQTSNLMGSMQTGLQTSLNRGLEHPKSGFHNTIKTPLPNIMKTPSQISMNTPSQNTMKTAGFSMRTMFTMNPIANLSMGSLFMSISIHMIKYEYLGSFTELLKWSAPVYSGFGGSGGVGSRKTDLQLYTQLTSATAIDSAYVEAYRMFIIRYMRACFERFFSVEYFEQ